MLHVSGDSGTCHVTCIGDLSATMERQRYWEGATKQRIQSSHMPPCHRHMVIATNLSSLFDLLHCSIPQTTTECRLEFAEVSGCRMFLGLSLM